MGQGKSGFGLFRVGFHIQTQMNSLQKKKNKYDLKRGIRFDAAANGQTFEDDPPESTFFGDIFLRCPALATMEVLGFDDKLRKESFSVIIIMFFFSGH